MKLVIEIDENVFTRLFDNGIQDNEIAVDDVCEMARALRKGTPLPKVHGRLIDGDALKDQMKIGYKIVENAPTIIEADKDCTDCILDGTDACPRGAGRAVDVEVCEDFIGESEGEE